jgi:hypothetical protein
MSYYLNPEHATQRLREEWDTYGGLIIAVDFDSTLIPYRIHEENADFELIRQLVRECKKYGCIIVINTGSEKARWEGIIDDLKELGIDWDYFNETPPHIKEIGRDGKVYANVYLDDRAGLWEVYTSLNTLLLERKNKASHTAYKNI